MFQKVDNDIWRSHTKNAKSRCKPINNTNRKHCCSNLILFSRSVKSTPCSKNGKIHLTELSVKSTSNKDKIDRRFVQDLIEFNIKANKRRTQKYKHVEYLETITSIVGKGCPWRRHWSSLDLPNTNLEQKWAVSTIPKIIVKSIGKALWAASRQLIGEDGQNTKSPKICNLKHLENNKLQQCISLWRTKVLMRQNSKHKPWAKKRDFSNPQKNQQSP